MNPEVGGVLGALGHRQRLVVRPLVLRVGQGVGVWPTPNPTCESFNSNFGPLTLALALTLTLALALTLTLTLSLSPDLEPSPAAHLHKRPVVVRGGPDDGLAFLGLHRETQVELGAAALLHVREVEEEGVHLLRGRGRV